MSRRPPHVLITGGSRGIGLAIAQLFAKNAYRCTLIARSENTLKSAISTLQPLPTIPSTATQETEPEEEHGYSFLKLESPTQEADSNSLDQGSSTPDTSSAASHAAFQHSYIQGDVAKGTYFWGSQFGDRLPRPTKTTPHHLSRIDVLVNCAGVSQSTLFIKTREEDIDNIVNTNLSAMMIGTRFLFRHGYLQGASEPKQKGDKSSPVIINISSLLGLSGGHGAVAYAASKAGVLGFTRALASEYASHRVRVNAIVPGYVTSDMTKALNEEQLRQRIPLGRFGTPEEIAQAALFLAQNEYAHNCVVNLDGGLSAV
ncbi:3-oxoacyl-reductase [Setomelanomma holmii]|uniref:3-oxoacyl-reductase n=1 Tax=Setomelanomma holmii TaxID=210430 RepID=A0A9P4HE09_9PLEO|nr:3-oxoacyl-reductase [Setomelanomma holmii]